MMLDVSANRKARKWSRREIAGRVLWALFWPLFRLSPRLMWGWRRTILRRFGAQVGRNVHIYPNVRISIPWNLTLMDDCAVGDHVILYALGPITIGARATVSQGAHLCAGSHDWRRSDMPLTKPPISVGDECWIAADAFIGPGVTIGAGTIVAARAAVMKSIAEGLIVGGNPARVIRHRGKEE